MAIAPFILKSLSQSKKNLSQAGEGTKKITSFIMRRRKVKRDAYAQTNMFRDRREQYDRRQQIEDELEAPKRVTQPGGPAQLVQQDNNRGFFDRILGFIGYLAAGWIMNNLPTWIGIGKEFLARLKKAGEIVSGFFGDTIKLFTGFGNLLSAAGENLMRFDFFDTSNRIKNAMKELNFTVGDMGNKIEEAYGLATTPLTEGKYSGEDIPGTGTQQTDEGAYAEPAPYTGSGGGGRWKPMLDLISSGEGGYESVNPGLRRPEILNMTISELVQFQYQSKKRDGGSAAVGRYQFITPEYAAKLAGLPMTAKFTPENQDKMAVAYLEKKRRGREWLDGKITTRAYIEDLAHEWGAFRSYSGYVLPRNSGKIGPERIEAALNQVKSGSSQSQQSQIEQVPVGNVNPVITSRYGERRGARTHGGTDLAVNAGTPLRAISDGFIIDSDFEKGWGNFLVMKDNRGIYHLYGHMQSGYKRGGPVKKGEVIGKVGMTGRTSGPHLHWEAGTGWNGGVLTGKFDPLNKYSKNAPFNTQPGPGVVPGTPAQIAGAPQQSQAVPYAITPERRGQDIIIAQPPNQQQIVTTPSGGGEQQGPSRINDFDLLNNFIKNKLLLDLAYL